MEDNKFEVIELAVKNSDILKEVVNEIYNEGLVSNPIQVKNMIHGYVDEEKVENTSSFIIYFYSLRFNHRLDICAEIEGINYITYEKWTNKYETDEDIKAEMRKFVLCAIQGYKDNKACVKRAGKFGVK